MQADLDWDNPAEVLALPHQYGSLNKAAKALGRSRSFVQRRYKAAGGRPHTGIAAGQTEPRTYYEGPAHTPPEAWNILLRDRETGRIEEGVDWQPFDNEIDVAEVRRRYLAMTDREEYALKVSVTLTERDYYTVIDAGDVHIGPPEVAYRKWLALLEWIASAPDTGLVINGDLLNIATKSAPGLGPATDRLTYDEAWALVEDDLRPLARAGKLHALLDGNHEGRIARDTGIRLSPIAYLCKSLRVPYCGYETFVRWVLTWGEQQRVYIGYHNHGNGNAGTSGAVHNAIERLAQRNRADYTVMAHTHRRFAENLTWRECDRETGRILTQSAPMVASGSYQKLMHGSYSADKGMQPADLGAGTVFLYADRQAVHART